MSVINSSYFAEVFDNKARSFIVNELINRINVFENKVNKTVDSIAFSGMSGAVIAPIIAFQMNKNLLVIRKKDESSHAWHLVEGDIYSAQNIIIIDDFISEGKTIHRIYSTLYDEIHTRRGNVEKTFIIGVFLYNDGNLTSSDQYRFDNPRAYFNAFRIDADYYKNKKKDIFITDSCELP